jgi:pimeloyl-ACP methyl ester carboxylesterase
LGEEKLETSQIAFLPDGRRLGYLTIGSGNPLLYFHGTASSRLEVLLLEELAKNGLRLIGVDRPGYGISSFKGRSLTSFNSDINSLMDYLDIKKFGVLGWSGGSIFALAYLAFFPERITKTVVAAAPSLPFDASKAHNMPLARYIMQLPMVGKIALNRMRIQVLKANGDIDAFMSSKQGKQMLNGCSSSDLKFFSDPSWMSLLYKSMAEAFRQGTFGVKAVLEEHKLFLKPWDFHFKVPNDKLHIWHGSEDKTCPVSNAYELSRTVGSGKLELFEGHGHCVMFENLPKLGELFKLAQ